MGIVVAAPHLQLGQTVALKCMRPEVVSPSYTKRFMREARASVKLKSQHAARVLDVGALAASLSTLPGAPKPTPQPSAWVSLGLEQRPYAQVFLPDPKKAEERELAADDWFERRVALIEALLGGEP